MFEKRCYNGGNKHKYVAVYNDEPAYKVTGPIEGFGFNIVGNMRSLLYKKVYVYHVCRWCGKTIKE